MRRIVGWSLLILLVVPPAPVRAGLPSGVTFEVGGGPVGAGDNWGAGLGGGCTVGLSTPMRPWVSVGAEMSLWVLVGPNGVTADEELIASERSSILALTAALRVMPGIRSGVCPFLVAEGGTARAHWGAKYLFEDVFPPSRTTPARNDVVPCCALGIGLRGTWPRPAPGFEICVRGVGFGGDERGPLIVDRLSLTY